MNPEPAGARTGLRLSRTHFPVTALGYGRRLGVWVQGCPLGCAGCVARDTWDPDAGAVVGIDELLGRWRRCVALGADGLTVSGGEPLAQPAAVAELLEAVAGLRAELTAPGAPAAGRELDILLYTGYEPDELTAAQSRALARADAVITGRYVAARPTNLIWRGSANQAMRLRTELGRRRYEPYLEHAPDRPPMQVRVDAGGVWLVGVPRAGTLPALERRLRERGLPPERVSWRPR